MRALLLLLATTSVGCVLLVPLASAQSTPISVSLRVDFTQLGDDGRLHPETEELVGSIWADVTVPPGVVCLQPVPVHFHVRAAPAYATVHIKDPSQYIQTMPSAAPTRYTAKSIVTISISRDAPAFEDGMYEFQADVLPPSLPGGCNMAPGRGGAQATVKNDYVPGIRVGDATVEHEGMSGWIDIPIENLANGPTRIYALLEPVSPESFVLLKANDVVLESRAVSGAHAAWTGTMRVGYVLDGVEAAPIQVRLFAGHDTGQSEYDQQDLDFVAIGTLPESAQGEQEPIQPQEGGAVPTLPGPGIPILMLVGGFLAALARRRRG